jgi:hypothetical protein
MDIAREYKLRRLPPRRDPERPDPRREQRLHIRCGEDILDRLVAGGLGGDVTQWADPLCEGPVRRWATDLDRRRDRAVHLALRYFLSYGEVLHTLAMQDHAVGDADLYGEVVLWFEHDLFDQAILAFLLDRLGPVVATGTVRLVMIDRHPSVERFVGLGQLDTEALVALHAGRLPVTDAQVGLARRVTRALARPTPEALARLARGEHPALPFLGAALRRYLAEYPSVDSGLSRTERLALEAVAGGAVTAPDAFRAVQAREAAPFQGDSMFHAVLRGLADGPRPLLAAEGAGGPPLCRMRDPQLGAAALRVTRAGEAVLAGRDDWYRLHGASRWIGGVHLIGPEPAWRWDEERGRLEACGGA